MFQRIGKAAYKADLRNTLRLAAMLDNPEEGLVCVHIAGTNGKGSTAHILASIFQSCGYKTGLMTSPHYKDYRERIKVNGEMISEGYVVNWVDRHRSRFEQIAPSFFELTVMMGFCYFKAEKTDIAIIETGLGGRLDSTNIVSPEISVITNIGMDHTAFLGDSLDKIAAEKAGIIKAQTPVVIGPGNDDLMSVFSQVARSRNAPLHKANIRSHIESDLSGQYQQKNLAAALCAVELLQEKGWELPESRVLSGMSEVKKNTGFVGRWQTLSTDPMILADAAHNVQGMSAVLENLDSLDFDTLHIVMGMVDDKDVSGLLSMMPKQATYHLSQAKILRAMPVDELVKKSAEHGLKSCSYSSLADALAGAKEQADAADLILITGSIFTVAELLPDS